MGSNAKGAWNARLGEQGPQSSCNGSVTAMQLLHLLEQEEQRVGGEAITQCPLNGNTVTNGNFTLIVKSNHK